MTRGGIATVGTLAALIAVPNASAAEGDFASAGDFKVGNMPYDLAVADFDTDGDLDVATPNANGSNVSVLLNDGDGTFTEAPESPIATDGSPKGVAAGDLSGDGAPDLVVTQGATNAALVLFSDDDGTFTTQTELPTGEDPDKLELADVNGDGNLDVTVVNSAFEAATGTVSVHVLDDEGAFSPAPGSPFSVGEFPTRAKAGNFNADAYADLAVTNRGSDNVSILLGSATGNLTTPGTSPEAAGDGADGIAIADFDEDNDSDLAIANSFSENTSILLGNNAGDFTATPSSPLVQGDNDIVGADLNGDDNVDLATFDGASEVAILNGNGAGGFSPAATSPETVLGIASNLASADLDNDGDVDLLSAGGNGGEYAVTSLLNNETDTDGDNFLDVGDECLDVPGATRGCPFFSRSLTLKYTRRAGAFKGVVSAEDPACAGPGVKVKILKSINNGSDTAVVARAKTTASGAYRVEERFKRGRFQAHIAETLDPQLGICSEAVSPGIQIKPAA